MRAQGWHVEDRGIDGNTTNSPRRRDGTGATFSRVAPQRPWQCRLDTGVPLATGRCEWRAASASKSAGLRRDVSDVPVASPQKVKQRGSKVRVSGPFLGSRCAAGHKTHPSPPLFPFRGFSDASRWLGKPVVGPRFRGLREPVIHHKGTNPRTGRGVSQRHPGVPLQPPNFYSSGTNPRTGHWTACLCPVKDVPDVTVEPPQENRERGKALGCFRPLATTGDIPRTGFQAPPCTVRCTVRDGAFHVHTAGHFMLERGSAYMLAVIPRCVRRVQPHRHRPAQH